MYVLCKSLLVHSCMYIGTTRYFKCLTGSDCVGYIMCETVKYVQNWLAGNIGRELNVHVLCLEDMNTVTSLEAWPL